MVGGAPISTMRRFNVGNSGYRCTGVDPDGVARLRQHASTRRGLRVLSSLLHRPAEEQRLFVLDTLRVIWRPAPSS